MHDLYSQTDVSGNQSQGRKEELLSALGLASSLTLFMLSSTTGAVNDISSASIPYSVLSVRFGATYSFLQEGLNEDSGKR